MGLLLEVLRTVDFLADQPPDLALRFMTLGRSREFSAGHVFWRPGQSPQGIVVPVSGELAAMKSEAGGRQLCYSFFGPGECAGIACAADGLPHATETRAIRGGEFFAMERAAFLRFLEGRPAVHAGVLAAVGRLVRAGLEERNRVVFLPVHMRVARFILDETCARRSGSARILLRVTHAELASRVGSVREVVARSMAGFGAQGLVRRTRRGVFVVDRAGLRAVAGLDHGDASDRERRPAAAAAAARTKRHFLPVLQRGSEAVAHEASICAEEVTDLSGCIASGCPLAAAARGAPAPSLPVGVGAACGPARVGTRRKSKGPVGRSPRAKHSDPPTRQPVPARRAAEHGFARSSYEDGVIERRVGEYRKRVAAIESKFGAEASVPASVSVFRDKSPASS